jgi:hypothetical protein
MKTSPALTRLELWPDLWRYPKLFVLVHGAQEIMPAHRQLLEALLEGQVADEHEAWQVILACDDIAAVQSAYVRLTPHLAFRDEVTDLAGARLRFQRRIEQVRDRARPLSAGHSGVEATLTEAMNLHISDPRKAEHLLTKAAAAAAEAERRELAELAARFPSSASDDSRLVRLAEAIATQDLRLAQIYASQLGDISVLPHTIEQDQRVDREPTAGLLAWRLDPDGLAPSWLPSINLTEHDLAALTHLEVILQAGMLSLSDAEQFLRATFQFLLSGDIRGVEIARAPDLDQDSWAFVCTGRATWRLYPHVERQEGGILLLVPRRRSSPPPKLANADSFVAWDLFENWTLTAVQHPIRATPRMLLDLLPQTQTRVTAFVRMQSSTVAVRPLILQVLAGSEARYCRLAGVSPSNTQPVSVAETLAILVQALDLHVDEGDLLALSDACGDCFSWLPLVFELVAQTLDASPAANRRFDALSAIRRPDVERNLEEALKAELRRLLQDQWEYTAIALAIVEDELVRDSIPAEGIGSSELSEALVRHGHAQNLEDAKSILTTLVSLGLLREVKVLGTNSSEPHILQALPFPGRVLLRAEW